MPQYYLVPSEELYHHGVVGMRWGGIEKKERAVTVLSA